MAKIGRSTVSFAAAGVLALAALAAFLVLDLAGGSVDPSSLPVIEIGQTSVTGGRGSNLPTQDSMLNQTDSTGSSAAPGSAATQGLQTSEGSTTTSTSGTTTGSTVREVVNGAVHTGPSAGSGGAGTGSSNSMEGR